MWGRRVTPFSRTAQPASQQRAAGSQSVSHSLIQPPDVRGLSSSSQGTDLFPLSPSWSRTLVRLFRFLPWDEPEENRLFLYGSGWAVLCFDGGAAAASYGASSRRTSSLAEGEAQRQVGGATSRPARLTGGERAAPFGGSGFRVITWNRFADNTSQAAAGRVDRQSFFGQKTRIWRAKGARRRRRRGRALQPGFLWQRMY